MRKLSLLALALFVLAGCRPGSIADLNSGVKARKIPAAEAAKALSTKSGQQLCAGVDDLGFNLLRTLSQATPAENVCISPASISLALGMTHNGAVGNTESCIANVLGIQGMKKGDFVQGCSDLAALFENADPKVEVDIANSIWVQPRIQVKSGFVDTSRQFYDASVNNVDLSSGAGIGIVNNWVKEKTKGKIPSILGGGVSGAMVLLDAVYFKGIWDTPFDASATDREDFHPIYGATKKVAMMHRTASFDYARVGNSQVLSIPYKSQQLAMLIYLPDQDTPLPAAVNTMDAQSWATGLSAMSSSLVALSLPKFSADYGTSLKNPLSEMGMAPAFADGADFHEISDSPMCISDVLHKTTMDVDEKGTVATAATAVIMGETSPGPGAEPPKPIEFVVDHPFLYAIYDTSTKAILFVGVVYDP